MTDPTRTVLARVAEFLAGLSATDVAALAEGRARLALLPTSDSPVTTGGTPTAAAPVPRTGSSAPQAMDVERAHAALAAMSRRDDGTAYLKSWTTRDLRALAARAGLRGVAGLRKAELVERIVDRTIGFRLDSTAIRQR
ncbi:Rho termination factor N-terminal domain-containing protein [Micromonospora narathiwatensis]|uniref:Rho termination factor, N-terminal domain n=1 Tax=Micromonospora narathiwatensis TaxID=299146 RepID=A0A1A9AER8_9ACTN|nr:Rho termination factor N-terminal domain-containing protein [Micromonospora narathiwatensis]SBT55018.1 Rho termination factor, N-terminal domain [Micromonospora narathiwatensis]